MAEDRSQQRIPKLTAPRTSAELRSLPLTPIEVFVLSRVDGVSGEDEIVTTTGLAVEQVRASLDRLVKLSLVVLGPPPPPPVRTRSGSIPIPEVTSSPIPPPPVSSSRNLAPQPPPSSKPVLPAAPPPTEHRVVGGIDLNEDEQRRIIDLFERLDLADYYSLLGVPRTAEKKEIKRAYYEKAALYHPDRYFRKNVGPHKPKLEAIFARVTLAHDTLTDKAHRAEYDAYLGSVAQTRELEERVRDGEARVRAAEAEASAAPPIPSASPTGTPAVSPPPPPPPAATRPLATPPPTAAPRTAPPAATAPPAPAGPPPRTAVIPPVDPRRVTKPLVPIDPQARRDLLAKHLMGGRSMTPTGMPAVTPTAPKGDPDALKRHYDQRRADMARAQASRHKSAGDQARAAGDMITAASSYKAALSFVPDDPELVRLHHEATVASETALAENYRKQAFYEEKSGRWAESAKSWGRLAQLLPKDVEAAHHAADALLHSKGSLHDAAAFAQRAISLDPKNVAHRALLVAIYLDAGLLKNAKRELDAAEQLQPGDASIGALSKRLAGATAR